MTDTRDYPEAYCEQELDAYGTKGHAIDKAAKKIRHLREQLAAAQAREQQLREALGKIANTKPIDFDYDANEIADHQWNLANSALALPQDTSALDQIKASYEAQIQQLREALGFMKRDKWHWEETRDKALALPQDTSALQDIVAKAGEVMRERCVDECDEAREAIRALPGVTMEDLK